jgi:hypothetical protein
MLCLVTWCVATWCVATHHVNRHITPSHNILWTAPRFSNSQKTLGTLPEDGNVMPKHVAATIINKLNELVYLLAFHAYVNEMHGSRSKIPSTKSRQAALRDIIPALKC